MEPRNTHDNWLTAWVEKDLKTRVIAAAKRYGVSMSAVIRWALLAWLEQDEAKSSTAQNVSLTMAMLACPAFLIPRRLAAVSRRAAPTAAARGGIAGTRSAR